jgi:glycosyltransferase involved in cell wall biosynthesis
MIAVSAAQAATFRQILRVPSDKITVIHNGIDPTTFSAGGLGMAIRDELGVPGSSPVLGMATGYFEYERVEDFLDAGARVLERVPAAHFFVVGDRHPTRSDKTARRRAELKRLALRLGLAQRVHFLGYRPDMASVLAALDVFVLPATFKCFGLILLEAMASAVPVVATDQGGAPEIVRHEQTGLLVPPLSPTALSNAIVRILRDPQTATRMGHCGRQVVREQFTTGLMVERTTTLYRSLLNDRRRVLSQGQLITR